MWKIVAMMLPVLASSSGNAAETPTSAQLEFFETRIRPVLVDQCYSCHNSAKTAEGGLAVDDRASLFKGSDEGAILVPGKPEQSRLIAVLKHEVKKSKMPKNGGKLDDRVIADFETWIASGAFDPRDKPPSAEELAKAMSWETIFEKRKKWWSFQPIKNSNPPAAAASTWSEHPIDRFVLSKLQEKRLEPSEQAEPRTLVRRTFFTLIGLPPTSDEIESWAPRVQSKGFEELVDHLLANPHFGERWARHWMDWIRYAESHGSEGDPAIDGAWMYRDYLIRALNADVPYDQLVREHIAGDLMEHPRINRELGINESMIGPAHWRMVFHGFAPTDALEEKVRFIDDEINTFSKAFLGLTVSCAKCHDHKFDPISQKDYYAIFGVLGSCRPSRVAIDLPEKLDKNRAQLAALKPQIHTAIADAWLEAVANLRPHLTAEDGAWKNAESPKALLHPLFVLHKEAIDDAHFSSGWARQVAEWKAEKKQRDDHAQRAYFKRWNLANDADCATWFRYGNGVSLKPTRAGEFTVSTANDTALGAIFPAGVFSNLLTAKSTARFSSDVVRLNDTYEVWFNTIGDGTSASRYVVADYPRNGTIYPVAVNKNEWQWHRLDASYWHGDDIHLEVTTGKDAPLLVNNEPRSWFGIREAVIVKKGDPVPPVETREFLDPIFDAAEKAPPKSYAECAERIVSALTNAIIAWKSGTMTDAQALMLDSAMKNLLPNQVDRLATAKPFLTEYRRLESEIVVPTRVPGLEETIGRNQFLLVRGNHKTPGDVVPRRFLEAIDATPYQTSLSGRTQLAESVVRDDNPLTRRVIVNRLWHHLFGRGIVRTPDNFGKLGVEPTHPELLDFLATRFKEHDGSLKEAIRFIVTSKTWQQASKPSAKSMQVDPDNTLLSHANVRRLEGEAIRDELLAVSGTLSADLYGPPTDGRAARRSIYVNVRRTALDPFLRAFDFPEPFSTVGCRDVTNVPAQSLTLMNDEFVATLAAAWAGRILTENTRSNDDARIQRMFAAAFSRPAQADEIARIKAYMAETKSMQTEIARKQEELAQKQSEMRTKIDAHQNDIRQRTEPVRAQLLADKGAPVAVIDPKVPTPIGRWDFRNDLRDSIGTAHGAARNGARAESGGLAVSNRGHAITAPLTKTIREKTLEAWVQLDTLDQRGGGVMTIQTPNGAVFDSIVFAEKDVRQWLAGSNNFKRTQAFRGSPEQDAIKRPIHLAIAYHADGRIAAYRDGEAYGASYTSDGPIEFKAGETVIGFGIRHLPGGANAFLSGRILRAQLYDRALSADEIRASSRAAPFGVSDMQVLAALSDADRKFIESKKAQIAAIETEIANLGPAPEPVDEKSAWTDVARAMFLFKEFIYVK